MKHRKITLKQCLLAVAIVIRITSANGFSQDQPVEDFEKLVKEHKVDVVTDAPLKMTKSLS